jgi:hypothetical protein
MYPIHAQMHNGASVADWLGTAAMAARVAATRIENVRDGSNIEQPREALRQAEAELAQVLDELRAIRHSVG